MRAKINVFLGRMFQNSLGSLAVLSPWLNCGEFNWRVFLHLKGAHG